MVSAIACRVTQASLLWTIILDSVRPATPSRRGRVRYLITLVLPIAKAVTKRTSHLITFPDNARSAMGRQNGTRFHLATADLPIALPAIVLQPGTSLDSVRIVMPRNLGKVSILTMLDSATVRRVIPHLRIIFQDNAQVAMTRAIGVT